jgi:uncharacterized oxidoreductase
MKLTGNTIFVTGGGSGIGRGLAEALHAKGDEVIVSGRRRSMLEEVTKANRGMVFVINNAGIMKVDNVQNAVDDALVSSIVTTNLLGPVRMTSALIEHLKQQPAAWVIHVTSGTAFVPLAVTAAYSATKAALHSFSLSQRYLLKDTSVKGLELAPPYVQTELMGAEQVADPRAMPLQEFIDETLQVLGTDAHEVPTERVAFLRNSAGPNDAEATKQVNDWFASGAH